MTAPPQAAIVRRRFHKTGARATNTIIQNSPSVKAAAIGQASAASLNYAEKSAIIKPNEQ